MVILGFKKSIRTKNKLYIKSRQQPTPHNISIYKQYRNNLNKLLRRTERSYYNQLLLQNKNNLKESWKLMKRILNKSENTSPFPNKIIINDKEVTDKKHIVDSFNNYFVNVGPSLSKKLPVLSSNPTSYVKSYVTDSMFAKPTNLHEITNIIMNLKNSSPGWDNINAHVVKQTYSSYIELLLHILNLSLSQGYFPNELKIAKVIPLFKNEL